jgi:hypothetical protein
MRIGKPITDSAIQDGFRIRFDPKCQHAKVEAEFAKMAAVCFGGVTGVENDLVRFP